MSKNIIPHFLLRMREGHYGPRDSWRQRHQHAEWQFDYLHRGGVSVQLAEGVLRLRARDAIVLPPQISHGLIWHTDSVYSSFKFTWDGAPAGFPRQAMRWTAAQVDAQCLQGVLDAARSIDAGDLTVGGCWLHLLLDKAWRQAGQQGGAADSQSAGSLPEQVTAQLAAGGFRPLSLAQMARGCHLSTAQFLRRFQQEAGRGITPAKFVLRLRLERAEALLRYGEMNLSQVAQRLGWPDVFTFSKAWKRHRGLSPRASLRQAGSGADPDR